MIELLVVIALISVLGAIGFPAYTGYVNGARDMEAQLTIRSIAAAQETFRLLNGYYFSAACDDQSPARISEKLLSNNTLNTVYFNYCTSTNNLMPTPNFLVRAINKKTSKEFTVDQDNKELTVNGLVVTVGF